MGSAKKESVEPSPPVPAKASTEGANKDVVLVGGLTPDRKGAVVLRARESGVEVGEIRPLEEGKPIRGDIVRLKQRGTSPVAYDVETILANPAADSGSKNHAGPARVATNAYRTNWDAIYGTPRKTLH